MKNLSQILVCILAVLITLATAILHGRSTNRWGRPEAQASAAAVIKALPHEFGVWHLVEREELSPAALGLLQCHDYLHGMYENRENGERVQLTLLLGPPGPMAVHTPEICYSAADFAPLGSRERINVRSEASDDTAWLSQFTSPHELQGNINRVYYAWSDGKHWTAADEPRVSFGGRPFLFKVQILVQLSPSAAKAVEDPARALFREFLPEFERIAAPLNSGKASS